MFACSAQMYKANIMKVDPCTVKYIGINLKCAHFFRVKLVAKLKYG